MGLCFIALDPTAAMTAGCSHVRARELVEPISVSTSGIRTNAGNRQRKSNYPFDSPVAAAQTGMSVPPWSVEQQGDSRPASKPHRQECLCHRGVSNEWHRHSCLCFCV